MPELPEVEITRRGIEPALLGHAILNVNVRTPKLRWPIPTQINTLINRRTVQTVERRGKYLLINFSEANSLIIHLGMSGSLRVLTSDHPPSQHDHVDIITQHHLIRFRDPRKFGAILWADNRATHPRLSALGPEPLSLDFDGEVLYQASRDRKAPIKNVIMHAQTLVGVGNIYANEALFHAKIHPSLFPPIC